MHVVVTGAAGFIGSHTVERLVAAGHRVTGIDSFDAYLYPAEIKRRNAAELANLPADRWRLVEGDICDPATVAAAITPDVDVVCHLAALAGVRPSLAEPLRYLRTNITGTGVIVERMRELGLQRLVFASSSSVYGAKASADLRAVAAFREDDPCLTPASPYAATKRMNELQLSTYRDLFGLGVYALRFFTVYGPRQRPDMAISKFLAAIAAGTPIDPVRRWHHRGATTRSSMTSWRAWSPRSSASSPRRTSCSTSAARGRSRCSSFVEAVETVVGKPAPRTWTPMQPGDVPMTYANIDRARTLLGYEPTTRIEEGIARQWAWVQGHR